MNQQELQATYLDHLYPPDHYGWRAQGSVHISWLGDAETRAYFNEPRMMPVLYRMTDAAGCLLYIGVSCRPLRRWHEHKHSKAWWSSVDTISFESISWNRRRLLLAESRAIEAESPRHNRPIGRQREAC